MKEKGGGGGESSRGRKNDSSHDNETSSSFPFSHCCLYLYFLVFSLYYDGGMYQANLMMDEYQARFMEMAVAVGMRRNGVSRRPNGVAPPPRPPTQSSSSSRPSRRSSLLFAVGSVAIVGSFVAYRALMKSH